MTIRFGLHQRDTNAAQHNTTWSGNKIIKCSIFTNFKLICNTIIGNRLFCAIIPSAPLSLWNVKCMLIWNEIKMSKIESKSIWLQFYKFEFCICIRFGFEVRMADEWRAQGFYNILQNKLNYWTVNRFQ